MRYAILVLVMFFFTELKAQYQTMFPVDSITWVIIKNHSDGTYVTEAFYTGKSTLINNEKYYLINGNIHDFWIREDTINGKTWFRRDQVDTMDLLLMDLGLQLNDKIPDHYCLNGWNNVIDTIEVEKIDTYEGRKVIEFSCKEFVGDFIVPLRYTEGFGSNLGFPSYDSSPGYVALCKLYYGEDLVYALDTLNLTCPINTDVNNFNLKEHITLFPNPASSIIQIQIENPLLLKSQLNFYTIDGKRLLYKQLNNAQTKIDISSFESQILFFEVKNNHHHFTGKILKQ